MKEFEGLNYQNCEAEIKSDILCMKFGGTSVGCVEGIQSIVDIITTEQGNGNSLVVVVSAMNGTTNQLRGLIGSCDQGEKNTLFGNLVQEHVNTIDGLGFDAVTRDELLTDIFGSFLSLENAIFNNENYGGERDDLILAHGEIISAKIISRYLRFIGIRCQFVNATEIIKTDDNFGEARVLDIQTERNIRICVAPLMQKGIVPVITGFIGSTIDSRMTTLGEGASDFTATYVARKIGAKNVHLYKKGTDGVYDRDPNKNPDAQKYMMMSQYQVLQMARDGHKVVSPNAMLPILDREIDVYIKDTLHPKNSGTLITSRLND